MHILDRPYLPRALVAYTQGKGVESEEVETLG